MMLHYIHEGGEAVCTSCRDGEYAEPISIESNRIELIKTWREYDEMNVPIPTSVS